MQAPAEAARNEESEAGPEAVAAAQQAMQQYGQEDEDNPQGARQLEEMMNAMIEQAYDEDMEASLEACAENPAEILVSTTHILHCWDAFKWTLVTLHNLEVIWGLCL